MYRIRDCQFENRYFNDGELFKTKEEIRDYLISYHSVDTADYEWLTNLTLEQLCCEFEWEIEEV